MQDAILASLRRLSDAELVARLMELAARDRDAVAQLVAHIAELDTRHLHLQAGYGSLFVYCRDALRFSEHEAYNRIEAGRAARRFPVILDLLTDGSLNLTTVRLLAPFLTSANYADALESARGKKKVEVEEIVAKLWPRPDVPPALRKLPAPRPLSPPAGAPLDAAATVTPAAASGPPASAAPNGPAEPNGPAGPTPASPSGSAPPIPLSPNRYKVQFTIGGETLEKLRLAKDMLRHAIPSGDDAAILDRALTALLAELARKKFAATESPRPSRGTAPNSRHVPAEVKRAVWLRDLGVCAFVGTNGRRCTERAFVEFHHLRPYAVGGEATVENVQLRCRRHNAFEATLYFGQDRPDGGSGLVREEAVSYSMRPFDLRPHDRYNRGARSGTRTSRDGPSTDLIDSLPPAASRPP